MNKHIGAIIQARTGSSRLPRKVLKDLCGQTVLEHVYRRVCMSVRCSKVIIATTDSPADDTIEHLCLANQILFYRGSEEDVLGRYLETARAFGVSTIVRITSDCPFIDPVVIDDAVDLYVGAEEGKFVYVSNTISRTFPRGLDVEVFSTEGLAYCDTHALSRDEREHVTPFMYKHRESFAVLQLVNPKDLSAYRLTLDTEDDWNLVRELYRLGYSAERPFTTSDLINILRENDGLTSLNAHVQQKSLV